MCRIKGGISKLQDVNNMSDWDKVKKQFKVGQIVEITSTRPRHTRMRPKHTEQVEIVEIGETGQLKLKHDDGRMSFRPWRTVDLIE